jgi:ubiquinone/menaquinone biosynthesis C-methylase UbiE
MTGWDEKMLNKILDKVHGRMIFDRRVNVLVSRIGDMVQSGTVILDVGTGDGRIAKMIGEQKASVNKITVITPYPVALTVQAMDDSEPVREPCHVLTADPSAIHVARPPANPTRPPRQKTRIGCRTSVVLH